MLPLLSVVKASSGEDHLRLCVSELPVGSFPFGGHAINFMVPFSSPMNCEPLGASLGCWVGSGRVSRPPWKNTSTHIKLVPRGEITVVWAAELIITRYLCSWLYSFFLFIFLDARNGWHGPWIL